MLGRYQIRRGASLADLPPRVRKGLRFDTRKHTRHCLRPAPELVNALLADPAGAGAWRAFARAYDRILAERFAADRAPFDALAELAADDDVFLGCNCPTARNPDPAHCHTVLALRFMRRKYPRLAIEISAP